MFGIEVIVKQNVNLLMYGIPLKINVNLLDIDVGSVQIDIEVEKSILFVLELFLERFDQGTICIVIELM